jgi:hypothetical protein
MKAWITSIIILNIAFLLMTAGCVGSQATESPLPSADQPISTQSTAVITTTIPVIPVPEEAVKMGSSATFGSDKVNPATVTVQRYALWDRYEWKNTFWGNHFFNTTPKDGNMFLVLFVKLTNPGSKPVYAPSPSQFVVNGNGNTYRYSPIDDPTLWINGTDRKQIDYEVVEARPDRYLNPDPNNAINGYIIYEVPKTFDPSQGYVELNLMGTKTVDWEFT